MPSTMTSPPSAEASALFSRWCDALPQQCQSPHISTVLLALFYESTLSGTRPSQIDIAACLMCDEAEAATWALVLETRFVAPEVYEPIFAAEDAVADSMVRRSEYAALVQQTQKRLEDVNTELTSRKTLGLLSETHAEEEAETVKALEAERVLLQNTQQIDFPAMAQLLRERQSDDNQRLADARQALQEAQAAHTQQIAAAFREHLAALFTPIREFLAVEGQELDTALAINEADVNALGSKAALEAELRRTRK